MTVAGPTGPARTGISPWALAAILCSLFVLCPVATMAGPLLGVKALADIRRRPGLGGRKLAVAAIAIGGMLTASYLGAAWWWNVNARRTIIEGPLIALAAGTRGDVEAFRAEFSDDGANAPIAEATAFLDELSRRYGVFLGISQREMADDERERYGVAGGVARLAYRLHFEGGEADADAAFVISEPGRLFILKWGWIAVRDPDLPVTVYPSSAGAVIDQPHRTTPAASEEGTDGE